MKRNQKIKIFSLAKFQAMLASLLGLVAGIVYSFGGLIIDTLVSIGYITSRETPGLSAGTALAFGALIGMPILFAVGGYVLGIIEAVFFNMFTEVFGGVSLDFDLHE